MAIPPAATSSSPQPEAPHFRLAGRSLALDARVHAIRPDIADIALADRLFASHYARPVARSCQVPAVALRSAPDQTAPAVSELLLGEAFEVVDVSGGWAWGYCEHDCYVGYLPAAALGEAAAPSHIVAAPAALVFAEADIKAPVVARWPMGARFAGVGEGDFLRSEAGFVHRRHAVAVDELASDPVAAAERLVGAPYRWGGRSGDGLDCSGLVQLALAFTGVAAPRDSDQQAEALGTLLRPDAHLHRGDLVFFPGHVGLMTDGERLIHANAFWMAVTVEPLADVVERLRPAHPSPITARRRIAP